MKILKKPLYYSLYTFFIFIIIYACLSTTSYGKTNALTYTLLNKNNEVSYPKEVFLTFDDGPCINNTRKILKILKDNNVKASFFVVGIKSEENPEILKEISDSGMCIGVHTYSHNYKKVYGSLDSYLSDYNSCLNTITKITGKSPVPYTRLPGGSTNLVTSKSNLQSIKRILSEKNIRYVDWNVCAGDAESHVVPVEKIKNNVVTQCKDKNIAVILMHDTYYKYFTVNSLPYIINYLKSQGYVFRTFNDITPEEESEMIKLKVINK